MTPVTLRRRGSFRRRPRSADTGSDLRRRARVGAHGAQLPVHRPSCAPRAGLRPSCGTTGDGRVPQGSPDPLPAAGGTGRLGCSPRVRTRARRGRRRELTREPAATPPGTSRSFASEAPPPTRGGGYRAPPCDRTAITTRKVGSPHRRSLDRIRGNAIRGHVVAGSDRRTTRSGVQLVPLRRVGPDERLPPDAPRTRGRAIPRRPVGDALSVHREFSFTRRSTSHPPMARGTRPRRPPPPAGHEHLRPPSSNRGARSSGRRRRPRAGCTPRRAW